MDSLNSFSRPGDNQSSHVGENVETTKKNLETNLQKQNKALADLSKDYIIGAEEFYQGSEILSFFCKLQSKVINVDPDILVNSEPLDNLQKINRTVKRVTEALSEFHTFCNDHEKEYKDKAPNLPTKMKNAFDEMCRHHCTLLEIPLPEGVSSNPGGD